MLKRIKPTYDNGKPNKFYDAYLVFFNPGIETKANEWAAVISHKGKTTILRGRDTLCRGDEQCLSEVEKHMTAIVASLRTIPAKSRNIYFIGKDMNDVKNVIRIIYPNRKRDKRTGLVFDQLNKRDEMMSSQFWDYAKIKNIETSFWKNKKNGNNNKVKAQITEKWEEEKPYLHFYRTKELSSCLGAGEGKEKNKYCPNVPEFFVQEGYTGGYINMTIPVWYECEAQDYWH